MSRPSIDPLLARQVGRITGYLADKNGGDYTYAFYGVTIAAGLAFATTVLIYILNKRSNRIISYANS